MENDNWVKCSDSLPELDTQYLQVGFGVMSLYGMCSCVLIHAVKGGYGRALISCLLVIMMILLKIATIQ